MTITRLLFAIALLVCGFAAGLVLTGRMPSSSETAAQPQSAPAAAQSAGGASTSAAITSALPDFSRVATQTVPAVTNISALTAVRRSNSPFATDPFFRYFFGDQEDLFGSRRGVQSSLGSGVVVTPDGYILTNNHVIAGERGQINVRNLPEITIALDDKRELRAAIIGVDPDTDLALVKVDAKGLPTIPWGDSSKLKVAEWVLAIGNPYQLDQTVTLGIVSAVGRRVGISAYEDFIQTDAAINPGNSGGALVNQRGELIGINTAIYSQSGGYQGIGFAVPSNLARRVMNELIQFGEVRRGSIGYMEVAPVTTRIAEQMGMPGVQGALVTGLYKTSAAYRAGVEPGDIIIEFNGQKIDDPSQLQRVIKDAKIGSTGTMTIIRDGREVRIKVPIHSTAARTRD